ncbi:hypothetical protein E0Z10_g9029 [Xylaria hypoxylon]|uniref:Apple domain-containing protein n=1 Tax=Xylaria hypoxylon TaxID=37992 RepID=A0A4Z0YKH1_9PEZI|nr:hypothetical protein E0Z10_g9029 [Xylaria hypoxylon]
MSHYQYSDLEVVPGRAPEVVPGSAPEVVPYYKENTYNTPLEKPRRICGLNPKTFWIVFGVCTVLIVGGIAGGVAGALASRNNSSSNSPDDSADTRTSSTSPAPSSSPSSTSTTPSASTPTLSTTTVVLPTATLLRDCPSSNGTVYDVSFGSTEPLSFRKFCNAGFRHVLNGIDVINAPTTSLNGCINACVDYNDKNKTAIASGDNQTCNAVCWRNTDYLDNINQIPGQCFAYTTLNTSSGFVVTDEVLCDSAAWINQRDL